MRSKLALVLLCGVLALAGPQAWACMPVRNYFSKDYPGDVFVGKAMLVRDVGTDANTHKARLLKIQFKVLHWLKAETARQSIEVNGWINAVPDGPADSNSNCGGGADYYATVGETRIVFGKFGADGTFQPDQSMVILEKDKEKIPDWLYRAYFLNQFDE